MSEAMETLGGLRLLELHYFRIPRERWELILARVRQLGANAVSSIVPWSWHESRDSALDLAGLTHPERDVADFLETCAAMRFQVILRPGPYAGAGLLGGGMPGWLLREHPEMCALDPDSIPRRDAASGSPFPSAEHPTYLNYLERWYRELSSALATWQWPDGPIVALRVDRLAHNKWDYNPHVIKVQWPVWLRQQYDGMDALNAAWETDYSSFNDAAFPSQPPSSKPSPAEDVRVADAARFVAYATSHASETYVRILRDMGWEVPIASDPDELQLSPEYPGDKALGLAHAVQVDPEPPQIGANVRWAMDAPLRPHGYPQRQFWAVKATLLGMQEGVKQIEGGTLVTGSESRRVRLPRPAGDYGVYRLLLDGQLLAAPSRTRGSRLYLHYPAVDEAGDTDMCFLLEERAVALTGLLREYLVSLLMGRAQTLQRAGSMCQALAEALSGRVPSTDDETRPSAEGLQAAENSLAQARRAARRAAASLGRLERLASEIRGEIPSSSPTYPLLSAFTPQELGRLIRVRNACTQAVPALTGTARSITARCREAESGAEGLTIQSYRAAFEQVQVTAREAETLLAGALGSLRADLAAGVLSSSAWPLQDWLTRILQGLNAGLLA
ncbi:MAG: beta-galactosidase [Anaerolineae bacterium]